MFLETNEVESILSGLKTTVMVPIRQQPPSAEYYLRKFIFSHNEKNIGKYQWCYRNSEFKIHDEVYPLFDCPYKKGDVLIVKESYMKEAKKPYKGMILINDVNAQKLCSITEDQSKKEGVCAYNDHFNTMGSFKNGFLLYWRKLKRNKREHLWVSSNPWVWVLSFEMLSDHEVYNK